MSEPLSELEGQEVDLWQIQLREPETKIKACMALLSADEVERAYRFRFQHVQDSFVIARGAMRRILGQYLNLDPRALRFEYGANGKPHLPEKINPERLSFNLSHSSQIALLAVTRKLRVGVDIESEEGYNPEMEEIAARHFTASEASAIADLMGQDKISAFFTCWTMKEAYVKAVGDGLSIPLNEFEVSFPPRGAPNLLRIHGVPGEHRRWRVYGIPVERGYAAALVVEGTEHKLRYRRWTL